MLELNRQTQPAVQRRLITSLAHSEAEILEAQRLRYKVFAEEMGANLPSASEGIDRDIFDKYCEHLLVRESDGNKVVDTYRILSPDQAQKIGGYYAQTEFDKCNPTSFDVKMKKYYSVELLAKFVRWVVVGILSFIVAIPTIVSLTTSV